MAGQQYKLVKGEDGRDYVELPGGVQFPADDLKERQPSTGGTIASQAYKLLNPEVLGGAAALLGPETGGMSLAIPPLVGAATSVGRDLWAGERDPKTIASDALLHAGTNLGAGLAGRAVTSAMKMGSGALDAASMLPKVGIAAKLAKILGYGGEAAAPAAAATDSFLTSTLPSGAKVFSSQGLKELVQKSIDLENTPGTPPATLQAIDQLIQRVRTHIDPRNAPGGDLLGRVGMPTVTAAQQKAAELAARAGKMGRTTTNALRAMLGLGSTTYEESR